MTERFERFTYAMSEISRHWHKLTSDEMAKYGLKGVHSVYLLALYHHPEGLTAPEICELCVRDKADVSRMMSIMMEKGLVYKDMPPYHRYRGPLKLTPQGMEAAKQVEKRVSLAVELAGKDLSDASREIFYAAMESILRNLRQLSKYGIPEE